MARNESVLVLGLVILFSGAGCGSSGKPPIRAANPDSLEELVASATDCLNASADSFSKMKDSSSTRGAISELNVISAEASKLVGHLKAKRASKGVVESAETIKQFEAAASRLKQEQDNMGARKVELDKSTRESLEGALFKTETGMSELKFQVSQFLPQKK